MRPIFTTSRWGQQLHFRFVRRAHPSAILNRFASNAGLTTSDNCCFIAARRSARGGQTTLNVCSLATGNALSDPHSHSHSIKGEGARGVQEEVRTSFASSCAQVGRRPVVGYAVTVLINNNSKRQTDKLFGPLPQRNEISFHTVVPNQ